MHTGRVSWAVDLSGDKEASYASVGGATGHTVVVLCMYVSVCLSVGRISRRSLKTKR